MTRPTHIPRLVDQTRRRLNWPALLKSHGPLLAWLAAFGVLALTGALGAMSARMQAAAAIVFHIGWILLLIRGLRRWRRPTTEQAREIVDALDESRPASTLIDRPVKLEGEAAALWAEHQTRVKEAAARLPSPSLFRQAQAGDPLYLRIIAPSLLVLAAGAAGSSAPQRLMAGIDPDFGALIGADKLTVQAWVAPPGYTNRAPFVIENDAETSAPAGSELTLRVNAISAPTLVVVEDGDTSRRRLERGEDGAYEARLTLEEAMTARIRLWGERARYSLSALEDQPPVANFTTPIEHDERDRAAFGWQVGDDYGVARLELVVAPTEKSGQPAGQTDAVVIELPSIEPREAASDVALDLTRHKWAGLEVEAKLRAVDAAGQEGYSLPVAFVMPARLFLKPLAKAAAETRFDVLRDPSSYGPLVETEIEVADGNVIRRTEGSRLDAAPAGVRRAAVKLDALTWRPETYFSDAALYLGLRQAHAQLSAARSKSDADEVESLLWAVALRAEYGDYASAAEELARARQALERALRDGASEEEIKRLMQAFRQAVENYLAARLAEAMRNGDFTISEGGDGGDGTVQDDDLERMLKAMEELAETGATDQARQLLSDMSDLLERLQNFNLSQGEGGQQMNGPMADALRELGEQLLQQRELSDDTRRAQQQQGGPSQNGEPQQGEQGSAGDLAERQQGLSEQLGRAMEGRSGEQGEPGAGQQEGGDQDGGRAGENGAPRPGEENLPPEAEGQAGVEDGQDGFGGAMQDERFRDRLAEARRAQNRAAQALREGDLEGALREQERATRALSEAATDLAETADEMNRVANGGRPGEEGRPDAGDPLGRPSGMGDAGYGDDVHVPDARERQRARDILDELRRRASERGLTAEELEYLHRLLDRF